MNRVRYGETSPKSDELIFFVYIKGLDFGKFPQLTIMNKMETMLEPDIWYCEKTKGVGMK